MTECLITGSVKGEDVKDEVKPSKKYTLGPWTFWSCEDYQHPQVLCTSPHPELPNAPLIAPRCYIWDGICGYNFKRRYGGRWRRQRWAKEREGCDWERSVRMTECSFVVVWAPLRLLFELLCNRWFAPPTIKVLPLSVCKPSFSVNSGNFIIPYMHKFSPPKKQPTLLQYFLCFCTASR